MALPALSCVGMAESTSRPFSPLSASRPHRSDTNTIQNITPNPSTEKSTGSNQMQVFVEPTMITNSTRSESPIHNGPFESIARRLKESPFAAVRRLKCEFRDGVLTLSGRVPTYYTKQIAISLACNSAGVDIVVDRLEVVQPSLAMT